MEGLTWYVRGNCPAHAHFDVCRVWPNVRDVAPEGRPFVRDRPLICPLIRKWFFSPNSVDWPTNDDTRISKSIHQYLRAHVEAAGCRRKGLWQMCAGLETAQGRV